MLTDNVIPKLCEFLKGMGLTLNDAKTRIVHREEELDFLGFHVQQFMGKNNLFCVMKPSKENIKRHLSEVKEILSHEKQATQAVIIDRLNPILRGWAYYYPQDRQTELDFC